MAGAAVLLATGCGSKKSHTTTSVTTTTTPAAPSGTVQGLNQALELEYRIIAVYTASVPLLAHRAHAAAKWFLAQELSHAAAVRGLIAHLGGQPVKQRPNYDLGQARGARALVSHLQELENAQIASYLAVVPQMSDPTGRGAIAAILSNEAQHVSILALLLGHDPFPSAFVTGRA